MKSIGFLVKGRVQGVYFRAWTQSQARELGLSGWVKNTIDGHVQGEVEGKEELLQSFLQKLNQGSPASRVDDVALTASKGGSLPSPFEVRY